MKPSFANRATKLAEQRTAARNRRDRAEVERLTRELDALYAEKRRSEAESKHGTHSEIVKRARTEVELERMMSRNGK